MTLAEAERLIEASADFRLLRRVPEVAAWPLTAAGRDTRRAVFVDTETTGLDLDNDEVIELALLPFEYERDTGAIVSVDLAGAFSGLRAPAAPIPEASARIHGITDTDVAGKSIDPDTVNAVIADAQLIIAHNAAFDRPMVEKLWPSFADKHWACSYADVLWSDEGLSTGKLDYLLMRQGWFFDSHRALGDALAGVFLLSLPLPTSKRLALNALLENARRPLRAVRAEDTAFEQRAALKQRGYRWDPGDGARRSKAWWIQTDDPAAEVAWLSSEIYAKPRDIPVLNMPATKRYSARLWSNR